MKLSREEQEMLEGKLGYPVQKAMEILVGVGECFNAEKMVPVASVHLAGCSLMTAGRGGAAFTRDIMQRGGRFVVFTDTNITAHDFRIWKEMGLPEDWVREDEAHVRNLERMGAFLCNTCTPYLNGHVPRFGEHVAWGESSAIAFVNSVLGARTNREGGPSALASALTGRTPEYGYHLPENRYGELKIIVNASLKNTTDYSTLGYFTGKIGGQRVPVFIGIPASANWDDLKALSAALACSGGIALFHIVGVTPEAPSEGAAFGPRKIASSDIHEFGPAEMRKTAENLSSQALPGMDLAVLGCPHYSIGEIKQVARLVEGRKLKAQLWVMTSRVTEAYAEEMGYAETIRAAGGKIVCDVCPANLPRGFLKDRGFLSPATNSAKMVFFVASVQDLASHYGSTEQCVKSAIEGVWR